MLSSGWSRGLGVGKFIHTGNECDLTVTDFLEHFGRDPEVQGIVMYLETIRDGRRFLEAARRVTREKPVLAYKAGRTVGAARAARSHTGALAGRREVFQGLFRQTGLLWCPTMELLLPAGQALIERPPMAGPRAAVITVGGSWGVALTDALEEAGLIVPELSPKLQQKLRRIGMPDRASTRNPVDFGASGLFLSPDVPQALGRAVLESGEADALIIHGLGRPGLHDEATPEEVKFFLEVEKAQTLSLCALEKEYQRPVLVGSHYSPWESQTVWDLNAQGVRVYNRLTDIAAILALMSQRGRAASA